MLRNKKGTYNKKVLFIGNFLSLVRGTIGPSEKLKHYLDNIKIIQASKYNNKILRFIDFFVKTTFYKYDTIHIDVYSGQALIFVLFTSNIAYLRKKKIILNLRGGKLPESYIKSSFLIDNSFNKATIIISSSKFLQDFFNKLNFKINYHPNFIDLKNFQIDKTLIGKPYSILWVRAFAEIYQPELAILVLHKIKMNFQDATLTMIGPDKGLLLSCQKIVNELLLNDSVSFMGSISNENLAYYYNTHCIFLNTTKYESFGLAVMEAAACGIPIVSTKVGELPLLWVQDKEILFSEGQTAEGLAEQVIRLFENRELCKQLSSNARRKAESFDWEVIKEKWVEILR